ncbi:MAG: hypothetical protein PW734_06435 [Verrucomicrobium sp.]|nr:hypothetical protein [Verrucomicrobium sp.]
MRPTSSFSVSYTSSTDGASLPFLQQLIELEQALEVEDLDAAREICAQLQEQSLAPRLYQDIEMRDAGKVTGVATLTRSSR